MMDNKRRLISDQYSPEKYPEMAFLDLIGHEVENFKPWFEKKFSRIKNTLIISPCMSAAFGIEVSGDQAFIGIPQVFFDSLYAMRMDSLCVVRGQAGIYLIVAAGPTQEIIAIRFFCSKKRAEMVSKCETATFMSIDPYGESLPVSDRNQFTKNVIVKEGLDWE